MKEIQKPIVKVVEIGKMDVIATSTEKTSGSGNGENTSLGDDHIIWGNN